MNLLNRLKNDVVLVAEGYVSELERHGYLKAGSFVPEVVLEYPGAVKGLHDEGSGVVGLNCGNGPATIVPFLEKIRKNVNGYVAGLPVPYRTTEDQPCFQKLKTRKNSTSSVC